MKAAHKINRIAWTIGEFMRLSDEVKSRAIEAFALLDVNTIDDISRRGRFLQETR